MGRRKENRIIRQNKLVPIKKLWETSMGYRKKVVLELARKWGWRRVPSDLWR